MLCRMLQAALPDKVESVYLANPSLTPNEILHAIAFELQLSISKSSNRLEVMQALQDHLILQHEAGRQVVVFVEEAQSMPLETLEEIRLLSNLETRQDKLLQIVLFGQPELDENLNQPHIRQLKERITHQFYLTPFNKEDLTIYIDFRLRKAGYAGPPIFTPKALKLLSKASEGLVRRANILADKALLACYAENKYQVSPKYMLAAIRDSAFEDRRPPYWTFSKAMILLSLLSIFAMMLWHYGQHTEAYNALFLSFKEGRSVVTSDVSSENASVKLRRVVIESPSNMAGATDSKVQDSSLPNGTTKEEELALQEPGGWDPHQSESLKAGSSSSKATATAEEITP